MRTDEKVKIKPNEKLQRNDADMIAGTSQGSHDLGTSIRKQVENGASFSGKETNHFWLNQGGKNFVENSGISGVNHNGDSRSFALFDYDHDGFTDMVVVNANRPYVQLFRNQIGDTHLDGDGNLLASRGGFFAVRFVGGNSGATASEDWSPRDGYGAKVVVDHNGRRLLREFRCGEGFASQNSSTMLVGLGSGALHAEKLSVVWPSGRTQSLSNVASGALVTVYENPEQSPSGEAFVVSRYERAPVATLAHHESFLSSSDRKIDIGAERAKDADLRMYVTSFVQCSACKKALPRLSTLRGNFADSELAMLAVPVNPNDTVEAWQGYNNKYKPAYDVMADLPRSDVDQIEDILVAELGKDSKADLKTPSTLITDGDGRLLLVMEGVPSVSDLRHVRMELAANGHHAASGGR